MVDVTRRGLLKLTGAGAAVGALSDVASKLGMSVAPPPLLTGKPVEACTTTSDIIKNPLEQALNLLSKLDEAAWDFKNGNIDPYIAELKSVSPIVKLRMQRNLLEYRRELRDAIRAEMHPIDSIRETAGDAVRSVLG